MIDTSSNMLYHIGNLNTENQRISYQMATGKAIDKGSEDSLLHASLINLDDKLRVTEDLKLQIEKSKAINDTADQNLAEVKMSLDGIKVDLMKGMNDGMDRDDKLALATNLTGIRENMFDRINTKVDGEYIFTGSETTQETLLKDDNFKLNGQVEFGGDGFLREIAVQPGSYRDRGVTAYDTAFYPASKANAGDEFSFSAGERIIDEDGFEWKLNTDGTLLQKYDHNGNIYHPQEDFGGNIPITSNSVEIVATSTSQAVQASYTIANVPPSYNKLDGTLVSTEGRVFEAKHNYFDDLNIIINALEGHATKLDGTKGNVISDALVRESLGVGLEQTTKQFDATNIGHGELGGRNAVFNVAYDKLLSQSTHYNILIQETGGADMAKLAMESKSLEMTYQALYSTIAKMNELSLVNFIR